MPLVISTSRSCCSLVGLAPGVPPSMMDTERHDNKVAAARAPPSTGYKHKHGEKVAAMWVPTSVRDTKKAQ